VFSRLAGTLPRFEILGQFFARVYLYLLIAAPHTRI
jgi:hypothetical protein